MNNLRLTHTDSQLPGRLRFALSATSGLLLAALLFSVSGCQLFGAALYQTVGPTTVKAKYTPPKTEPMLILVEKYRGEASEGVDADRLSSAIADDLSDHKVAPIIPADALYRLRETDGYRKMTIDGIGRAVGAQQVLYVNLIESTIDAPEGSEQARGHVSAEVRIVDVKTGNTLWPTDTQAGVPLTVDTPYMIRDKSADQATIRTAMHMQLATNIGHLLHDWQPDVDQER